MTEANPHDDAHSESHEEAFDRLLGDILVRLLDGT
jgi:hypothetical protein